MRKNQSAKFLRQEWFGGFEYNWQDNFIEELNRGEFRKRALVNHCIIKSKYPHYIPCPIRVNIDLTYFCNRNCIYCHSNSGFLGPNSLKRELKVNAIVELLKDCEKMGVFEITLTGGEPLLKEGIFEILECAGNLKQVFSNLITNGMYIDKSVAKRIKRTGIKKVCVSIDGFEETMDKHRWRGSYKTTISALKNLLLAEVNVGVISVISQYNLNEFESFVEMLYKLGVRNHNSSALCDIGRARDNWLGLNYQQMISFSKKIDILIEKMKRRGYVLTFNNAVINFGVKPKYLPIYIFEDAVLGWKCVVKPNGEVIYDRVWGPEFSLGSVKNKSLYDIWLDSEPKRARFLRKIYKKALSGEMSKIYYRIDNSSSQVWHWQSALIHYYQNEKIWSEKK